MSVTNSQAVFGLVAAGAASRPLLGGTLQIGQGQQVVNLGGDIAFAGRAVMDDGGVCEVALDDFAVTATAGSKSGTLDPTGTNNQIVVTTTDLDIDTAAIVIDSSVTRTQLTAAESGGDITVTSGDKRRMLITADFGDGSESVSLIYVTGAFGNLWSSTGTDPLTSTGDFYAVRTITGNMVLQKLTDNVLVGSFTIAGASGTPEAQDWATATTAGTATSTPTVTAAAATASQAIAAINAASITGVTAANATGSDGTGTIAAVSAVTLVADSTEWQGATVDFQGDPFQAPQTILGVYLYCRAGEAVAVIDTATVTLTTGQRLQIANTTGIFSTTDTIELTASENGTEIDVVVIASTE